jgi:signal transduction histidine kinase
MAQHELVRSEKQREAEQVRTRIARDIHDEIGGELTRIRLLGNEVRHLMESDQEAASATIERMARSAQEATGSLRDIVWATDPGRDTVKGLVDHLPDLLHRQLEGSGITAELNVQHDGPDREVDPAWKSQVLRIVKEAVNNAVKYSGARSIGLVFRSDSHGFQLTIHDDGRGFLPANTSDGNGLRNMRARSAAIHGEFGLSTAAGEGCTITVTGPLPAGMSAA